MVCGPNGACYASRTDSVAAYEAQEWLSTMGIGVIAKSSQITWECSPIGRKVRHRPRGATLIEDTADLLTDPRLTHSKSIAIAALVIASLVPLGFDLGGRPVALYHLLAFPLAILSIPHGGVSGRVYLALGGSAVAVAVLGALMDFGSSLAPLFSVAHFLAPYAIVVAISASRQKRAMLTGAIWIGLCIAASTILGMAALGRPTVFIDGSLRFSVSQVFPHLAGNAQVNTWATVLVAVSIVGMVALEGSAVRRATKLAALMGVLGSLAVIPTTGSRATTLAAIILISIFFARAMVGAIRLSRNLAVASAVAALLVGSVVGAMALREVSDNPRVAATLAAVREGHGGEQFAGRDVRAIAMIRDVGVSPLIGTAFRDFAWRQPQLADSSPHNQWLGSIHKAGLPIGLAYLGVIFLWLYRSRGLYPRITLAIILGLGLAYDALTSAPSGVWLMAVAALSVDTVREGRRQALTPSHKSHSMNGAMSASY